MKRWLWVLIVLSIVDRYTKQFIITLKPSNAFGGFIVTALNRDQAFSLSWPTLIFWPTTILLIAYCFFQTIHTWKHQQQIFFAWGLIVMGALSNLIDRVIYGSVIDFIHIFWWPIFNVSDMMIVIGIAIILRSEIYKQTKKPS